MKNTRSANFCADQIDVITNFAVIANVIMKRFHCSIGQHYEHHRPGLYIVASCPTVV